MPKDKHILGTALRITVVLNVDTVTSALITIRNPGNTQIVTNGAMVKDDDRVYSYVFQSTESQDEGTWTSLIKVVYGGYTSISETNFNMVDRTK